MLNEHQDNHFIKEQSKVEKYLLRIIQRYFDIENNFTKESIEAMIIESLTRFKQMIISEKGFIFSLNKQTGNLTLTIRDFGGEPAIIKKTAFNKDFGDTDNTICEGNDPRLSDDREPTEHVHQLTDINGLKEKLEELNISGALHTHNNKNVLDLLQYTGTQTQFDLIIIEHLQKAINDYVSSLQKYDEELSTVHNKYIEKLTLYLLQINQTLLDLSFIINSAEAWLQEAYKYTDSKVQLFKDKSSLLLSKCLTKEQINNLLSLLNKSYNVIADGEIPITDGTISFTPILEGTRTFIVEGEGEGESSGENVTATKEIIDSSWLAKAERCGAGTEYWKYSDSFYLGAKSYTDILHFGTGNLGENVIESYAMIISANTFNNYTHRVTLKSAATANDCISVVLACNKSSGHYLSLLIGAGGVNDHGVLENDITARVVHNFTDYIESVESYDIVGITIGEEYMIKEKPGLIGGWSAIENGISVLTIKENNILKIWIAYNEDISDKWQPDENGNIAPPTEEPAFTIDFNDENNMALSNYADVKCGYGYGTYSQPISIYDDIYFFSPDENENPDEPGSGEITITEPYGHTNICESNTIKYTIPESVLDGVSNPNVKFFFQYGEDDKKISIPLPVSLKDNNGNHVIIQASYTKDGDVVINTNFLNKIQIYATESSLYNNSLVIPTYADPDVILNTQSFLDKNGCELYLVDSDDKNNFVKNLLLPNREYYIQGYYNELLGQDFYKSDGVIMSYTDWDSSEPVIKGLSRYIKYNTNKKWATADGLTEEIGFVAEYKLRKMTQFFTNPRVYYQVLGNKEVI
jgi:hypothetical protein